jgi:glycosyltransferase involved in cell wall biosynthesis
VFGSAVRGDDVLHGFPVRHVGRLFDEESLVALYSAADVFVAPSLQDNLPNTVLEAAACGLPAVAFDVGGMSDLIDPGETGWLAAPGDVASLTEALLAAVRDERWRAAASRAARLLAEQRFSQAVVAQAHARLYREALASRREAA